MSVSVQSQLEKTLVNGTSVRLPAAAWLPWLQSPFCSFAATAAEVWLPVRQTAMEEIRRCLSPWVEVPSGGELDPLLASTSCGGFVGGGERTPCWPLHPASSCAQSFGHHRRAPSFSCHTRARADAAIRTCCTHTHTHTHEHADAPQSWYQTPGIHQNSHWE